jgi:hypothetical protein
MKSFPVLLQRPELQQLAADSLESKREQIKFTGPESAGNLLACKVHSLAQAWLVELHQFVGSTNPADWLQSGLGLAQVS